MSQSELARRLNVRETVVRRMLDPKAAALTPTGSARSGGCAPPAARACRLPNTVISTQSRMALVKVAARQQTLHGTARGTRQRD
jgi:hypothetical protein